MILRAFIVLFCVSKCLSCSGCKHTRVQKMQSADCFDAELREVPKCLKSDIEVLDLSYNRIRQIKENDLKGYPYLRYLYLSDNMIYQIAEEALTDKSNLETLDISYNSFGTVPSVVFHLPSLRTLYMGHNHNINIVEDFEKARPIISPLVKLDIAYNIFKQLPNLGVMPSLVFYNLSGNSNVQMNTSHVAGLCKLETLVMANFSANFLRPCDCFNLRIWLLERKVKFDDFICAKIDCHFSVPEQDLETYNNCLKTYDSHLNRSRLTTIFAACFVGCVVICAVVLYVYIKRERQKSMKKTKAKVDAHGLL